MPRPTAPILNPFIANTDGPRHVTAPDFSELNRVFLSMGIR